MRRSCCSRRPGGVPDGLCTHVTLSPGADPDRPDHLEPVVCRDVRWPGGDLQGKHTGPRGRGVELAERQPRRADPAYPCTRSEEHKSELQSLMPKSYAVF